MMGKSFWIWMIGMLCAFSVVLAFLFHIANQRQEEYDRKKEVCEASGGYYYYNYHTKNRCSPYPRQCIEYTWKNISVVQRLECEKLWEIDNEN